MIYHHLRALTGLMTPRARLYSWRARSGQEVDFVVEHGRRPLAIEVKRTAQVGYGDAAALRAFLEEYPEAPGGLLLYGGRAIRRLHESVSSGGEKIMALPWTTVAG